MMELIECKEIITKTYQIKGTEWWVDISWNKDTNDMCSYLYHQKHNIKILMVGMTTDDFLNIETMTKEILEDGIEYYIKTINKMNGGEDVFNEI